MKFSVLVVCTGNLCRSPAAEVIFRSRLDREPISVASAGTAGVVGHDIDAPTAVALKERGLAPSPHAARRLTAAITAEADLVLTADSGQRSIILQRDPLALRRTFTLREFVRLGAALPPATGPITVSGLRERVREVAQQRGWVEPGDPGGDDIGDPIGAGLDVARDTVATIDEAVTGVLAVLGVLTLRDDAGRSRY